jgi:hypothetical protein
VRDELVRQRDLRKQVADHEQRITRLEKRPRRERAS